MTDFSLVKSGLSETDIIKNRISALKKSISISDENWMHELLELTTEYIELHEPTAELEQAHAALIIATVAIQQYQATPLND